MKSFLAFLLSILVLTGCVPETPVASRDVSLTGSQIHNLVIGTAVIFRRPDSAPRWIDRHYPDGSVVGIRTVDDEQVFTGNWAIRGNLICYYYDQQNREEHCFKFVQRGGHYYSVSIEGERWTKISIHPKDDGGIRALKLVAGYIRESPAKDAKARTAKRRILREACSKFSKGTEVNPSIAAVGAPTGFASGLGALIATASIATNYTPGYVVATNRPRDGWLVFAVVNKNTGKPDLVESICSRHL